MCKKTPAILFGLGYFVRYVDLFASGFNVISVFLELFMLCFIDSLFDECQSHKQP